MPSLDDTLVFAAAAGNYKLVRERIEAGANVDHVVPDKGSALYAGIRSAQCVALLLSRGADPNGFTSEQGHTTLDHALSMTPYHTAQSAFLIYSAGGRTKAYSVLPPPTPAKTYQGFIQFSIGDWFSHYALGQVCFGVIRSDNERWLFDCTSQPSSGHFFRIEALYLPDRFNIHCVERTDDGFMLVDFRGRRHCWTGSPEEVLIDATVSSLYSPEGDHSGGRRERASD